MTYKDAMNKKVLVAMSGGVDSSVAAYLLLREGYTVVGLTMCLGIAGSGENGPACCGESAIEDARKVCRQLGIPHYVLDFSRELNDFVITDFLREYARARTPNPCVRCNKYLKFGKLFSYVRSMEFDFLATGHYARIIEKQGRYFLARPRDRRKDQTYFLYGISPDILSSVLFPLADYTKEETRALARDAGLAVAEKEQSQDICFIRHGSYKEFLESRGYRAQPGDIVTREGIVLGRHHGLAYFTCGQRSGLKIASKEPLYVLDLDSALNRVVVGPKSETACSVVFAGELNWFGKPPAELEAKIRYAHKPAACRIAGNGGRVKVVFDEAQEAVTAGQSIVFYDADILLGGGIIERASKNGIP